MYRRSANNRLHAMNANRILTDAQIAQFRRAGLVFLPGFYDAAETREITAWVDEVAAWTEDNHVVVRVKDQGDGVPADERERVFQSFYRGENSRRRGAGGTGLGLAISQGIVESHGGNIWLESGQGDGSSFLFTIPLAKQTNGEAPERNRPGSARDDGEIQ